MTYTLIAADEGKVIQVRVSFTDDRGHQEALTSAATGAVATRPNNPATGALIITGTAQVGQTVTADTTGIADADGLTNVSYTYQWLADNTDISGATSRTYTLTEGDEGKTLKVTVSFTDDEGNEETLTSAATDAVAARPNSDATGAPTISGTAQVGETLTASISGIDDADGLTGATFAYLWFGEDVEIEGAANNSYTLADSDEGRAIRVKVSFTDGAGNEETLTSEATAAVASRPNSEATGSPTVTGTAQVGETLTADTSGIADTDGLDDGTFSYQWIRNDGTADTDIQDATGSTYTLVDADEGKAISVRVSFPDAAGNEETLTSAATDSVAGAGPTEPPSQPTGLSAQASHDEIVLTWDDPGDASITGYVILRRNRDTDAVGQFTTLVADTETAATTYTDDTVEAETPYTYRIKAINAAGTSERSRWVHTETLADPTGEPPAEPANSEATGVPTISGTAQVGETLTADVSDIADPDGLDNASFSYQWLADDAEIAGATGSSYTLGESDKGKTISVRVSFTDDAGNEESLTSEATAVAAAETAEPPSKPTGLTAEASHDSVVLTWEDPGDDSITGYVILRRNRDTNAQGHFDELVADTGTDATTYTDDTVAAETRYTYRIKAINGAGESERSRWFHVDTPAVPTPAQPTGLTAQASHDSIVLTWDDPGDDAITGYVILRRNRDTDPQGHFNTLVADTGTAAATYTDDTVEPETPYTYRIKAINAHGESERSRWFHVDTPAAFP